MPVDPGGSIQWAKTPAFTSDLLAEIALLPAARRENLFLSVSQLDVVDRAYKKSDLARITANLFVSNSLATSTKHEGSVTRRLNQLLSAYKDDIRDINLGVETLDALMAYDSNWNDLHALLRTFAGMPRIGDPSANAQTPPPQNAFYGNAIAGPAPAQHVAPVAQQPAPPPPPFPAPVPHLDDNPWYIGSDDSEEGMEDVTFEQPAAPAPAPQHNVNPNDDDDDGLPTSCYVCHISLPPNQALVEAHLNMCFSNASEGRHVPSCVVCDLAFSDRMSPQEKEAHLMQCLNSGAKTAVAERDDFVFSRNTIPREADGSFKECSICYDDFGVGQQGTRILRCSCVFHSHCIANFFRTEQDKPQDRRRACIVEH